MTKNGLPIENKKRILRGFTLIELLVVMAVLALLVSIIAPVLKRSREKTKQIVCMAHLRDIGIGMHMYSVSNKDYFPDNYTLGGFSFRAAPGYIDPHDKRGLPEIFGLAAVLDASAIIPGTSEVWVCPAQPHKWMKECGNTYAFSIAGVIAKTKVMDLKRFSKTWLVWDNYTLYPYTPGLRSNGSEAGFSIATKERLYAHNFIPDKKYKDTKAVNVLYADSHAAPFYEQP